MRKNLSNEEKIKGKALKEFFLKDLKTVECRGAKLRFFPNDLGKNRVVFCLVRHFKNAVSRNKAKRVIREIYRKNKEFLKKGFDLAFILFPGDNETETRYRQFQCLVSKANLFEENK